MMLKLEDLDLDMIASLMQDDGSMGVNYYLNTETGEIVMSGFDDDEFNLDAEELEDEKYKAIDRIESYESYQHMEDFTITLPEGEARTELEQALIRSKPFRHFKETLGNFPDERKAWFTYKDHAMYKVVTRWLVHIEAIEELGSVGIHETE